ncbi:MAG: hypothetical protein WC004_01915 [Candidatus Absconditabacterales bacterium]
MKITSLEGLIWDEEVKQLTVDTMLGQITVLPGHDNLIAVLKPGLIKLVPVEMKVDRHFNFLIEKEYAVFGVLGGILKVEDNEVQILTNMVITDNQNPLDVLLQNKVILKDKLQKANESHTEMHAIEADLEKIELELKIAYWKEHKTH